VRRLAPSAVRGLRTCQERAVWVALVVGLQPAWSRGGTPSFVVPAALYLIAAGRPAQIAVGIQPIRGPYDLRHTYATFALRAGVPVFAVSRFIGSSIAMIDRHYGLKGVNIDVTAQAAAS
jgi:integrase